MADRQAIGMCGEADPKIGAGSLVKIIHRARKPI